jgi:bifunctional enzyme CysN/CysC
VGSSSAGVPADIAEMVDAHERKSLLRFLLCGSVDDGKSTLIGRLLYETQALYADQLAALEVDSRSTGTQGGELDFALLTDGLAAEREQGITIDVAYRHFSTERRHFIVADAPGHEQYTRNMVTGASTADCAVILIDARKGVLRQTRRHSYLVALLGIPHVVVAVNKMDQVDYAEERFDEIEREYGTVAQRIELEHVTCIPVSALRGENVLHPGGNTPWYTGPTLMQYLEAVEVEQPALESPFRMPVQWVNRSSADFRGFAGTVVSGSVRPGDEIQIAPSGATSRVARIVTYDSDLEVATAGQAVTVTLEDEIDASRGDVIATSAQPPRVADVLQATVVWMHEEPMLRGRSYLMRIGSKTLTATVAPIKYKLNVDSLEHVAATKLELNEIGVCDLELSQPVAFDHYQENRDTGSFILIDRITNDTVGAGLIEFALRRSANIRWERMTVDRDARAEAMRQTPCVLWLTGLSGAGKSTIANRVEAELHARGHHTYLLDGDNVRHGLNRDLGFTDADRVENIRRVAEVSRLMVDAGLIVLVSFISPFRSERQMARALFDQGQFFEVYVDTPLAVAEERDPKGLYKKARSGDLQHFTGIDSPYEHPEAPEIRVDTTSMSAAEAATALLDLLEHRGLLPPLSRYIEERTSTRRDGG